ncbi:MAG: Gfo/Idh/MocA family oxidoreductase [Tepidisphaeraceae bacterium]|jgi:predicted dehydrogenase
MNSKLRWGILGTGNIARQFAEGVRQSERGVLAAVGSRSAESAIAFAARFGVPEAEGTYDKLISHPSVDAVYNSLPNTLHHQWTIAALRAGKHVLCEKPIGATAAEAEEMFDVATASGKVLVEAFMYRSHPLTLAIIEAIKRGEIGELNLIRSSFCFRTESITSNIRFDPNLAGGSLMDVGCYCINFSRLFAGAEPTQVHAVGKIHERGVDEMAAGTLTFPGGILASFVCGMRVHTDNTAYLCGSEGYIQIPIPWKPPSGEAIYIVSRGIPPRMDKPAGAPPVAPQVERRVAVKGHLYGIEADDFAATVQDGQPPRLSREDSVGNMRVLDEARRQVLGGAKAG